MTFPEFFGTYIVHRIEIGLVRNATIAQADKDTLSAMSLRSFLITVRSVRGRVGKVIFCVRRASELIALRLITCYQRILLPTLKYVCLIPIALWVAYEVHVDVAFDGDYSFGGRGAFVCPVPSIGMLSQPVSYNV